MKSYCIFDLDDTLAPIGGPISSETTEKLHSLSRLMNLGICSGKPVGYLLGVARQLGIKDIILLGEYGLSVQWGVDLPPKRFYHIPTDPLFFEERAEMERRLKASFPDLWFQPNEVALTPFPKNEADFAPILACILACPHEHMNVVPQKDCFDLLPLGMDKGTGIAAFMERLGIDKSQLIYVGDGGNDAPAFAKAGLSIRIGSENDAPCDRIFPKIEDALDYLLTKVSR